MIMRKMTFLVLGAALAAFSFSPVLAQDADDASAPTSDEVMIADVTDPGSMADLMFGLLTGTPTVAAAGVADGGPVLIAAGPGGEGGPPAGAKRWHHDHDGPFAALEGPLALSDDQWERLWAIHGDSEDQVGPKKLALHTAMRHFMAAVGDSNQDTKKIKDLQNQIASLKADLSQAESSKLVAMSQVLTGDQRAAIHKMMIRHMLMHKWHGHHGGPGGPEHGPMHH